jgi:hypothetical protein
MKALHKDGGDSDHHKIGGMMMEFMVMESTIVLKGILFTT